MKATIYAVCAILALLLADCLGGKTEHVAAVVGGRLYHPAYTTLSCHGKPLVCTTQYHPPRYELVVKTDDGFKTIGTNSTGYATTHDGARIHYSQRRGCMSHYAWFPTLDQ